MQQAISLPFSFNSSGYLSTTSDEKKIWQDRVLLAVMTSTLERVMLPNYGTKIKEFSLENLSTIASRIEEQVGIAFGTWLKSLTLESVNSFLDTNTGYLDVEINYKLVSSSNTETMVVKTGIFNRSGDLIVEAANGQ
jgi:phage baseplate assembly protein W